MIKEIYEALKARISIAPEDTVKFYYEDYPDTPKDVTVYKFDMTGLDEDIPAYIHAMKTKNMWNVAQRFYSFLYWIENVDEILLGRHVSASNTSKAKAMKYLSDEFMLDMLSKVQPFQAEILKTGRSAHVDAHYHVHEWDEPDHILDFDFYVFEDTSLIKAFEFNAGSTEEELEAELASLIAYAHSL